MSALTDLLDLVTSSEVPNLDQRVVGYLAVLHPKILEEAVKTITEDWHRKQAERS